MVKARPELGYGPDFNERAEAIREASGLEIIRFSWRKNRSSVLRLGSGSRIIDFDLTVFEPLFSEPSLTAYNVSSFDCLLSFSAAIDEDIVDEVNQELLEEKVLLFVKKINKFDYSIQSYKPRFFETWDVEETDGNCKAYRKNIGPYYFLVTDLSGSALPLPHERYQIGLYNDLDELEGTTLYNAINR